MKVYAGISWLCDVWRRHLSHASRELLRATAFARVIECWEEVDRVGYRAQAVAVRALLDRFWDTTSSFQMPLFELGPSVTGYAVMSGLPMGDRRIDWEIEAPSVTSREVKDLIGRGLAQPTGTRSDPERFTLVKSKIVEDYFRAPRESRVGDDEQEARLWLWWFLGTIYFGDKGSRLSTVILTCLVDLTAVATFDWVRPALGLLIKYLRAAVRPEIMDRGLKASLVCPSYIMESFIFAHFPRLLPADTPIPVSYPAFHGWAMTPREGWSLTEDRVRSYLNSVGFAEVEARPWDRYEGLPAGLLSRTLPLDPCRLYLDTPFQAVWYLGERYVRFTTRGYFVVPRDPPRALFEQCPSATIRQGHGEGQSDILLLPDEDYYQFADNRQCWEAVEVFS